jgi:hypothetical protein
MSLQVRTSTSLTAVPVYEDASNGGALQVILTPSNLGAVPIRTVPRGTGGAVPVNYGTGYVPPPPPPDVPPTLVSATIDATGMFLTLVFSEAVQWDYDFTYITLVVNATTVTLSGGSGSGTSTLTATLGTPALEGEEALFTYDPFNESIQDLAGNPLGGLADLPVTNNAVSGFTYLRPGGVFTYFRPDGTSQYIRP